MGVEGCGESKDVGSGEAGEFSWMCLSTTFFDNFLGKRRKICANFCVSSHWRCHYVDVVDLFCLLLPGLWEEGLYVIRCRRRQRRRLANGGMCIFLPPTMKLPPIWAMAEEGLLALDRTSHWEWKFWGWKILGMEVLGMEVIVGDGSWGKKRRKEREEEIEHDWLPVPWGCPGGV